MANYERFRQEVLNYYPSFDKNSSEVSFIKEFEAARNAAIFSAIANGDIAKAQEMRALKVEDFAPASALEKSPCQALFDKLCREYTLVGRIKLLRETLNCSLQVAKLYVEACEFPRRPNS